MVDPSSRLIQLRDLQILYGKRPVLHNLDLNVGSGELIALAGPNGSGKSTLLKSLVRCELASQGVGEVCGHSIMADGEHYNTNIGYVSESLNFQVKAKPNDIAGLYQRVRPQFSLDRFERVLDLFSLDTSRPVNQYSRGQKVQFAFALAIATEPKLILLDEVTSVLDIHIRDIVLREVSRLIRNGSSALVATNILTEVTPYATRLLIIDQGKIRLDTPLENLREKYLKIQVLESEIKKMPGLRIIKGNLQGKVTCLVPKIQAVDSESLEWCQANDVDEQVTAEDVFLYYCKGVR